jgi:hypothetical protein
VKAMAAAVALSLLSSAYAHAQSLCGVWKPVEVVIDSGPDVGRHTTDVQPGLFVFTDTYYAGMGVRGFQPRPPLSANPTDEERGRVLWNFTANAGTYVLHDSTFTVTPIVSKNPELMTGGSYTDRVRVLADSFWIISTSGHRRNKWVRIERTCDRSLRREGD